MDKPGIDSDALVSKQGGEDMANSWAQYGVTDCEHRQILIDDVKRVRLRTLIYEPAHTFVHHQQ